MGKKKKSLEHPFLNGFQENKPFLCTSFGLLDWVPLGQSPGSSSSTPGLFLLGPKLLFMSLLCINNFVQKELDWVTFSKSQKHPFWIGNLLESEGKCENAFCLFPDLHLLFASNCLQFGLIPVNLIWSESIKALLKQTTPSQAEQRKSLMQIRLALD